MSEQNNCIVKLLSQNSFIMCNKTIIKKYGTNVAVLLGALCGYQTMNGDKEFYIQQEQISEDTGLSEYEIRQALKVLCKNGVVIISRKGQYTRNYYHIEQESLLNALIKEPCFTGAKFTAVKFTAVKIKPVKGFTGVKFAPVNNYIYRNNSSSYIKKERVNKKRSVYTYTKKVGVFDTKFEQFWSEYPKKINKQGCYKAFRRIPKLESEFEHIMEAVHREKQSEQWRKSNGQFIPYPLTWLHQERWKSQAVAVEEEQDEFNCSRFII